MFNICELHTNVCQVFLTKENSSGTSNDGVLLAVGGRYDWLVQEVCDREHKMNLPGAVGVSLALETIFQHLPMDLRPIRFIVLLNLFHDLKWKHLANLY
jgi:hypothetical protein